MSLSYPIHESHITNHSAYLKTMRGNTQFIISVQHNRIQSTDFADNYFSLLKTYQETIGTIPFASKPLFDYDV